MLVLSEVKGFLHKVLRSKAGIWFPGGVVVPRGHNVLAVLRTVDGTRLIPATNIVTDAGDLWYAQKGCNESVTNVFGIHEMQSAGTPGKGSNRSNFTAIGSSQKAHKATYPKRNDTDADNTGAGTDVVTFCAEYNKADFSGNVTHGIITNTTPGASEPILTGYAFANSFNKTTDDTLKVFVNHTMNGV